MKRTVEISICDICKEEKDTAVINYPVIFYTDQCEGRCCEPYISQEKIDVCKDCKNKICLLNGWGAQGHNEYKVRKGDC